MSKTFDEIIGEMEDRAGATFFENDTYIGIGLGFTLKGFGFGAPSFGFNKETMKMCADTECCSVDTLAKIIRLNSRRIAQILIDVESPDGAVDE